MYLFNNCSSSKIGASTVPGIQTHVLYTGCCASLTVSGRICRAIMGDLLSKKDLEYLFPVACANTDAQFALVRAPLSGWLACPATRSHTLNTSSFAERAF